MCSQRVDVWGRNLCDESRSVSEAASHRKNAENDLQSDVEGKVESTVIALRVGVDDLEEHFWQKRLRWFAHIVRRDEKVEIKCWS